MRRARIGRALRRRRRQMNHIMGYAGKTRQRLRPVQIADNRRCAQRAN
jgi:hypothetical protein